MPALLGTQSRCAPVRPNESGAEETRTPNFHVANVALYQLSYRPFGPPTRAHPRRNAAQCAPGAEIKEAEREGFERAICILWLRKPTTRANPSFSAVFSIARLRRACGFVWVRVGQTGTVLGTVALQAQAGLRPYASALDHRPHAHPDFRTARRKATGSSMSSTSHQSRNSRGSMRRWQRSVL